MIAELEIILLGVSFGSILMPILFIGTNLSIDYLESKHSVDIDEMAAGE